jgi:hypothetical protein
MTQHSHRSRGAALKFLAVTALALAGGAVALVAAAPVVAAAPEPAPIPKRWQLDIEPAPLRLTTAAHPDGTSRPYFYMTYEVVNNSKSDLLFAPSFELATDEMALLRSGRDVPVTVTNDLIERHANPFLEDQISIVGTLFRGPENAKEGLVAWPVPSNHMSEAVVYCAGFSGETATLEVLGESGKPEKKLLRKTLELRYRMPGDLNPAAGAELTPYSSRWIMR